MRKASEEQRAAKKEAYRRYYHTHREVLLAKAKNYREEHREQVLRKQAEWRAKNPERFRAAVQRHMATHREDYRRRAREWWFAHHEYALARARERNRIRYATDPKRREAIRDWQRRNREKFLVYVRVSEQRRRAARGNESFSAREWFELTKAHAGACSYCGERSDRLEADHRLPLSRGGSNLIENILPACPRCNRRKHQMTEEEFRQFLRDWPDWIQKTPQRPERLRGIPRQS